MKRWDSICRQINKPYFNLVGAGLASFAYLSLGHSYNYITKKNHVTDYTNNKNDVKYIEYDEVTLNSLPF